MKNSILFFLPLFFIIACKPQADFKKDGGIRMVLEADTKLTKESSAQCMAVLAKRLDFFGASGVTLREGETQEQIIVEIPGKYDLQRLRSLVQHSGTLSFYETYESSEIYPKLNDLNGAIAKAQNTDTIVAVVQDEKKASGNSLKDQLKEEEKTEKDKNIERLKRENPLFAILSPSVIKNERGEYEMPQGPVAGYALEKDTAAVNAFINGEEGKKIFGHYTRFLWSLKPMKNGNEVFVLVAVRTDRDGKAGLTGNIIKDARKVYDDRNPDQPQISMTMTSDAAFTWMRMTKMNIGKSIAIASDDHIVSYPTVLGEIKGGVSSITGNFTVEEVDDLISMLKSGDLPVGMHIVKEEQVSPVK